MRFVRRFFFPIACRSFLACCPCLAQTVTESEWKVLHKLLPVRVSMTDRVSRSQFTRASIFSFAIVFAPALLRTHSRQHVVAVRALLRPLHADRVWLRRPVSVVASTVADARSTRLSRDQRASHALVDVSLRVAAMSNVFHLPAKSVAVRFGACARVDLTALRRRFSVEIAEQYDLKGSWINRTAPAHSGSFDSRRGDATLCFFRHCHRKVEQHS